MDASLLSAQEVLEHLDSSPIGLTPAQVRKRLRKHGANQLRQHRLRQFVKAAIEPLSSLYMIILMIAIAISLAGGETLDAAVIAVVVLINAAIAWSQSISSERVLQGLRKLDARTVDVIRDGKEVSIPAERLVPGDVMVLAEGMIVPADGRLLEENNLEIDESSLTGESLPVTKQTDKLTKSGPAFTRSNMVFKGTTVKSGRAQVCVTSTGSATELGQIAQLAREEDTKAPIQVKIDRLAQLVIVATAVMAAITFGLGLLRGYQINEMIRFAIAFSVSAIPEGLPVTLAIVLLLGVRKMAKRQALVRHLPAVETLGMVTVIATDKTGTLTQNRLTVADTWAFQDNDSLHTNAGLAISTHEKEREEPVVTAIAEHFPAPRGWDEVGDLPFSGTSRMSAVLWEKDDKLWAYALGAPEAIIKTTKLTHKQKDEVKTKVHLLAALGYRVLALSNKSIARLRELGMSELNNMNFLGLIALGDTLRSRSKSAIAQTKAAGIKVIMLTGDHKTTAAAIADKLGIARSAKQVIEGSAIDKDSAAEIRQQLKEVTVLARIIPEAKYKVVSALKGREIIAMTGDGVNDAPALAQADIGIAMGSGTDAAKDAADMVLLNDDFGTIVEAIKLGRTIYANIRKLVFYLLSSNLGEALTMMGALLIGLPLPLTAVQILWINLITDSAVGIPLGLEPEEDHFMKQPPRPADAPLLGRVMLERLVLMAVAISGLALTVFWLYLAQGEAVARTMTFYVLVVIQWANAFNARSERSISLAGMKRPNIKLWVGIAIAAALQVAIATTPLRQYFGLVDIPENGLITLGISAIAVILISDLHKLIRRTA